VAERDPQAGVQLTLHLLLLHQLAHRGPRNRHPVEHEVPGGHGCHDEEVPDLVTGPTQVNTARGNHLLGEPRHVEDDTDCPNHVGEEHPCYHGVGDVVLLEDGAEEDPVAEGRHGVAGEPQEEGQAHLVVLVGQGVADEEVAPVLGHGHREEDGEDGSEVSQLEDGEAGEVGHNDPHVGTHQGH